MTWSALPPDGLAAEELSRSANIHPITAQCLLHRGIGETEQVARFFDPKLSRLRPPMGLAGFALAVERVAQAVCDGQRIGIFGDYDMDGVTSAAVLASYLKETNVPCSLRVAHRDRGYGFGVADAQYFADEGCKLVLIADCGTSDIEAVSHGRNLGLDIVVIDHHTVPAQADNHPATVLVNPLLPSSQFNNGMASVGLSFYLVCALRTELKQRVASADFDVRQLLDLVAIGTIGDMVPLIDENRILVSTGLRLLSFRKRPGLRRLLSLTKVADDARINERLVGWRIGPYLNAPGRMGDAKAALDLLLSSDADADAHATTLIEVNERRRTESQKILDSVLKREDLAGRPIVVADEDWLAGVVGIAASRLKDKHSQPAFVIAIDSENSEARGSARAPQGCHLVEWLKACDDLLIRFGGHKQAAGFSIHRDNIPEFRKRIEGMELDAAEAGQDKHVDMAIELGEVDARVAGELSQFSPFGKGNEEPRLGVKDLDVKQVRLVGDGNHVKMVLADNTGRHMSAIAFRQGKNAPPEGARLSGVVTPRLNHWGGKTNVELQLHSFVQEE